MTVPDLRHPLFAAADWYVDLVAGATDDHLDRPTPCTEFDVRALLVHVSTVLDKLVAFGTEHRDPYAAMHEDRDELARFIAQVAAERVDGHTPAQRAEDARGRAASTRAAWTDDVLDTDIELGWGPVLPGRVVAGIYVMELLAHGWDLATATGQNAEAPHEVAEVGLAAARQALPEDGRETFPFDAPVTPAADAGPTERLANWTGRTSR